MSNDKENKNDPFESEKKDRLEAFVEQHQEAFDVYEPGEDLFSKISIPKGSTGAKTDPEQDVFPIAGKKKDRFEMAMLWRITAVLLVGLALFYLYNENQNLKDQLAKSGTVLENEDSTSTVTEFTLASVSPEMAEVENFYISEVDSKLKTVKKLKVDKDLLVEVDLLNEEFNQLKEEMKSSINDQQIIEAMIDNYRLKIDLLDHILDEYSLHNPDNTTGINQHTENENEKNTTPI